MDSLLFLGLLLGVVGLLSAFLSRSLRYHARMFSDHHFREFYDSLRMALQAAKRMGPEQSPSREVGTAFETGAGLLVAVTLEPRERGRWELHVSMSQPGRYTTHSVASHFGYFVITMLRANKAECFPYYTQTRVHHLSLLTETADLAVASFEESYAHYRSSYRSVSFRAVEIDAAELAQAAQS